MMMGKMIRGWMTKMKIFLTLMRIKKYLKLNNSKMIFNFSKRLTVICCRKIKNQKRMIGFNFKFKQSRIMNDYFLI